MRESRARAALVFEESNDRQAQGDGLLARHDRHIGPEDVVQLDAAWIVGRDHGRACRQRLDGDGGQRLQPGRQHEQIRGRAVCGDCGVVDQAGERHVAFHSTRSGGGFELLQQRTGSADDQPRVGVDAHDVAQCRQEIPLARQRMQALDVQE